MRNCEEGSQTIEDRVKETEGEKRREGIRQKKHVKERKLEADKEKREGERNSSTQERKRLFTYDLSRSLSLSFHHSPFSFCDTLRHSLFRKKILPVSQYISLFDKPFLSVLVSIFNFLPVTPPYYLSLSFVDSPFSSSYVSLSFSQCFSLSRRH